MPRSDKWRSSPLRDSQLLANYRTSIVQILITVQDPKTQIFKNELNFEAINILKFDPLMSSSLWALESIQITLRCRSIHSSVSYKFWLFSCPISNEISSNAYWFLRSFSRPIFDSIRFCCWHIFPRYFDPVFTTWSLSWLEYPSYGSIFSN